MKYALILSLVLFSCSDRCETVVSDYLEVKELHQKKTAESCELYSQLEAIPIDSVQDRSLIEDELMMVLIDVAVIEIEMEAWKKQHVDCLNSY
jgi:hypothetical protein